MKPQMSLNVNDIHSQLNPVTVAKVEHPRSSDDVVAIVRRAMDNGEKLCVAGGRHSMGGQQFAKDAILVDTSGMNRVLSIDEEHGIVEIEAGIQWPELMQRLQSLQKGKPKQWGIVQKQTGADRLSIGGAVSSNVHGRGFHFRPIVQDIESIALVDSEAHIRVCDRKNNPELFSLAVGGYGLFGVICSVKLRLMKRYKVRRVVELTTLRRVADYGFAERIRSGFSYGDFQFSIDENAEGFMRDGVFSCYEPVEDSAPISEESHIGLSYEDWSKLTYLAHTDKEKAFHLYAQFYMSTSGQIYWSDHHQLSTYTDGYHGLLDKQIGATIPATEMITELYVPRDNLYPFMEEVREDFLTHNVNLIYGTVRLIEQEDETFLNWARRPYACIIFNLHVEHSDKGLAHSAETFRRLIDMSLRKDGSYFLTYHRFARKDQIEECYPQFPRFLELKKHYDPQEMFQSEWYRHYLAMFGK